MAVADDILRHFLEADEILAYRQAMDQWERSLKRPDLSERDRVHGALLAFSRQMLATNVVKALQERGSLPHR